MLTTDAANLTGRGPGTAGGLRDHAAAFSERQRGRRYPISRWYLRPAAGWLAAVLGPTPVRPVHLTLCGLTAAAAAAAVLVWLPQATPVAAALVLLYWLLDRADGQLARRQATASARGAWLDGNVDELVDVGLHAAAAAVLAGQVGAVWPWWLLMAFLAGKHLLMYGLALEEHVHNTATAGRATGPSPATPLRAIVRRAYHLPGNADVRVHLLVVALAGGWLAAELAMVAVYYNLRWIVRYALVLRRLEGAR